MSDIVSFEQEASDVDNLKEEIVNLSFAGRRGSEEPVPTDPRELYTYMMKYGQVPLLDLD